MVIKTTDMFIPVPKLRNTKVKVTIAGDDLTSKVMSSEWIKPVTVGIGTFSLKLSDIGSVLSETYNVGDDIKFYYDNTDGTKLQFWGRLDFPKDIIEKSGQFLEIEGRHRSWRMTETYVNYSATGKDHGTILIELIEKYLTSYGYTTTNVQLSGINTDIEWNYVPLVDCIRQLCTDAGFDWRIDDDLDNHFFPENSIMNTDEYISEKYNFRKTKEWGKDDYYERTRVTAVGQDLSGLPIIYTGICGIDNDEPDDDNNIREYYIRDVNANTEDAVKAIALGNLNTFINRPKQGVILSMGLENINAGDNFWISVPRQKIHGIYKALEIRYKFGTKVGPLQCTTTVEKEDIQDAQLIEYSLKQTRLNSIAENPNGLNYTYNFDYSTNDKTYSHSSTEIDEGFLTLSSLSVIEGTWISITKLIPNNITSIELRTVGKDLTNSEFWFSLDNRVTWQKFSGTSVLITGTDLTLIGRNLAIKVILKTSYKDTSPQLDSLVALYS